MIDYNEQNTYLKWGTLVGLEFSCLQHLLICPVSPASDIYIYLPSEVFTTIGQYVLANLK